MRRHLRAAAPGAELDISWRERALVSELLETDQIDFAIGRYDNLPGSLRRQSLYQDENVVVAHADHEILRGPLSIKRLTAYPRIAVSFEGRRYGYTERALALAGGTLSSEIIIPYGLVGPLSVCETDLVVFTSRRVAERLGGYLPLGWRPLPFELEPVGIEVLWHPRGLQDPAKAWFLEQLVAVSGTL